jgi:hypothetical protein
MRILLTDDQLEEMAKEKAELHAHYKSVLKSGKVAVRWSQMRGGYAIFVSGRMYFELYDGEDTAWEWINGILGAE